MGDKLPEKIGKIEQLRVVRGTKKTCTCKKPLYEIDINNHLVYCKECGAIVEPFTALTECAMYYERIEESVSNLLKQRNEIKNYKPRLVVIKQIEKLYNGYKEEMCPSCPTCGEVFELSDLTKVTWHNKKFYGIKSKL